MPEPAYGAWEHDDYVHRSVMLPAGLAELQVYPDSGHGAWRDEPEAAFAALRRFILA